MKYCPQCHVKVNNKRKTCPLCYHVLEDDGTELVYQSYPSRNKKQKLNFVTKFCLLLSIIAIVASVFVNAYTVGIGIDIYWSIIVFAAIIYLWILGIYVVLGHGIITSRIIVAIVNASVVVFLIEAFLVKSRTYWFSLDMVIPFMIIGAISTVLFLMLAKKNLIIDTLFPLFGLTMLSLLPLLLTSVFDLKTNIWPEISCAAVGMITLIYMLIFHFTDVTEEFRKRLHF